MNVCDLINDSDFILLTDKVIVSDIYGVYCGDLLSWVMSHAKKDNLWCTVLTHVNIIAVAHLVNLSCIVICEDAPIDEETIEKANQEKINLIKTKLNSFEVIKKLLKNE